MSYAGGCGYSCGSSGSIGYSRLENIASSYSGNSYSGSRIDYLVSAEPRQFSSMPMYDAEGIKKEVYADNYRGSMPKKITQTYNSGIDSFLNPNRQFAPFIGDASEIKEFVEDVFFKLTGKEFPDDVAVRIVSKENMEKMHPANVAGFAINRKHLGMISEIFVKKDMMDKVMLTIGHELGHVLTKRLENDVDEEAKAFAFSIAWMKAIKEHNIANLSTSIRLDEPARNGLHDIALDFVLDMIQKGRDALEVYTELIKRTIKTGDAIW